MFGTHEAPRRQNTPHPGVRPGSPAGAPCSAPQGKLLFPLADGDGVDGTTFSFFLRHALKRKEEQRRKVEEEEERRSLLAVQPEKDARHQELLAAGSASAPSPVVEEDQVHGVLPLCGVVCPQHRAVRSLSMASAFPARCPGVA